MVKITITIRKKNFKKRKKRIKLKVDKHKDADWHKNKEGNKDKWEDGHKDEQMTMKTTNKTEKQQKTDGKPSTWFPLGGLVEPFVFFHQMCSLTHIADPSKANKKKVPR